VEALAKLREAQKQADAGTLPDPSALTVEGFLRRWAATVGRAKRGTTQDRRSIYIEKHIIPFLGNVRLNRLGLVHLEAWLADLERAGRSRWTRHQAATMLGTALRRAVAMKLIPFNPAADLAKPRPEEREVEVLTEEQSRRLLQASAGHRLHALYVLALTSGMREGSSWGCTGPR
jgi:integrase